jgi:hypothetical protein
MAGSERRKEKKRKGDAEIWVSRLRPAKNSVWEARTESKAAREPNQEPLRRLSLTAGAVGTSDSLNAGSNAECIYVYPLPLLLAK